MTKEMAKFLKEASENAGNECDIRENYSGRCMYGKTTCGVEVNSVAQLLADVIQYISEHVEDDDGTPTAWTGPLPPDPENFRVDNMGLGIIVY